MKYIIVALALLASSAAYADKGILVQDKDKSLKVVVTACHLPGKVQVVKAQKLKERHTIKVRMEGRQPRNCRITKIIDVV